MQQSLLLYFGGAELIQHLQDRGNDSDFEATVRAINKNFDPQLNPDYEQFKLRQAQQLEGEAIELFYGRLCRLAWSYTGANNKGL